MKLDNEVAKHWFALPLQLRVRWWEETNYGREEPSPELLQEVKDAAAAREQVTHK